MPELNARSFASSRRRLICSRAEPLKAGLPHTHPDSRRGSECGIAASLADRTADARDERDRKPTRWRTGEGRSYLSSLRKKPALHGSDARSCDRPRDPNVPMSLWRANLDCRAELKLFRASWPPPRSQTSRSSRSLGEAGGLAGPWPKRRLQFGRKMLIKSLIFIYKTRI
jgi:hypothetical protein